MAAEITEIRPDGLRVNGERDRFEKITRKQRGTYDVGRPQMLPLSAGDRLLIRGREDNQGFANGDFKTVARVDVATGEVIRCRPSYGRRKPSTRFFAVVCRGHEQHRGATHDGAAQVEI
jgi:hypothetical protein